jgi:beta-lactamase regulating signal transducer with metallopeptidase domain/tetratricopeptide (TPR) repeat protein
VTALESFFGQAGVYRLGWTLLHFFWQGAALALLLAAAMTVLRRRPAHTRYLAACASLGLMSMAPILTFAALPPTPWIPTPGGAIGQTSGVSTNGPSVPSPATALPPAPLPAEERSTAALPSIAIVPRLEAGLPWLVAAWLVGVLVLSIRLLGAWAWVQRLKRRSTQSAAEPWPATFAHLCQRMRLRQPVRLLQSAWVQVPTVLGWWRPVVLVPLSAVTTLPPAQLEVLLAHELAHVRRHDYLVNLLQSVVETLLFYHPAVWWVSERIRLERENCCDDWAVSLCGDRLLYARALTAMEELRSVPLPLVAAVNGGPLLHRIRRVLGVESPADSSSRWSAGFVVLAALVGLALHSSAWPAPSTAASPPPSAADGAQASASEDPPTPRQPQPASSDELERTLQRQLKLLVEKGDDPAVRRDTAVAYRNVAEQHRKLGRFADAEASLARARELLEKLVQAFPAESGNVRELARTQISLGLLFRETGRVKESEQVFRQSLALSEKLANPQQTAYREDLATAYSHLGELYLDMGRVQEAEQSYRRALALLQQLPAERVKEPGPRQQLARTHGHLGDLLQVSGRPAEAEAAYRQALVLAEQLVREAPKVEEYRRDLARTYNSLGLLMRATGRLQEAEQMLRRALAILTQLVAEFVETPEMRLQLARCYNHLGRLLAATGRIAEAEAAFRQGVDLLEKSAVASPEYATESGSTLLNLAQLLRSRGELAAAAKVLERAVLTYLEPAQRTSPQSPRYRLLLRNGYTIWTEVNIKREDYVLASRCARNLASLVDSPDEAYGVACLLTRCVTLAQESNTPMAAEYRLEAVQLLVRAHAGSFFKKPANLQRLEKDKDLDLLRGMPEFKALLRKVKGE